MGKYEKLWRDWWHSSSEGKFSADDIARQADDELKQKDERIAELERSESQLAGMLQRSDRKVQELGCENDQLNNYLGEVQANHQALLKRVEEHNKRMREDAENSERWMTKEVLPEFIINTSEVGE